MRTFSIWSNHKLSAQKVIWLMLACFMVGSFWTKPRTPHFLLEISSFVLILFILSGKAGKPSIHQPVGFFIVVSLSLLTLYLLPVPIEVWLQLPGRDTYREVILLLKQSSNAASFHSLSLDAYASVKALLALLPPLAVFLGTTCLEKRQLYQLIGVFIAIATFQAGWGMIQYTLSGTAQGSFANYNHYAALMGLALPLTLGRLAQQWLAPSLKWQKVSLISHSLAAIFIFMGGLLSTSRAGTAGLIFGLTASILVFGARFGLKRLLAGFGVLLLLTLMSIILGIISLPERFSSLNPWEDPRWAMFSHAIEGIKTFFPFGTGPGTFADAYTAFQPLGWVGGTFVSHAHNDYLELLFETGVIGMGIIISFMGLFLHGLRHLWQRGMDNGLARLQAGAAISILTALLHACFDFNFHVVPYPVFFAVIAGLFFMHIKGS